MRREKMLARGRSDLSRRMRGHAGHLSIALNVGRRWSSPEPQPSRPEVIPDVRLNAIIPTWCEVDVIGSTVMNAFTQGCDRVLVVDNASSDDTAQEAKAAGAEIARVYETKFFDDQQKLRQMMDVIDECSSESGADHVWWLLCDADEFPHGPGGLTIHEYVAALDRRFRVVGARVFDHFPSGSPAYVPGRHPIDYQPLCQERRIAWCSARHWKHPLIRWDREGPPIGLVSGFHRTAPSDEQMIEPTSSIFLHHFQYRDRDVTYERLRKLCEPAEGGGARTALQDERRGNQTGAQRRFATLDRVYAGEWDKIERPGVTRWKQGVQVTSWGTQVPAADAEIARWYS